MLRALPYEAVVAGIPFSVQGSLLTRPGLSADTTVGNWEFPELTGLPIGVHVTPENVDLLELSRAAGADRAGFVAELRDGFAAEVPRIVLWLAAETLLGIALGLVVAAAVNMSIGYLRGRERRPDELRHRLRQLGAAALVTLALVSFGVLTYNPDWVRQSRLTGTLAAAQLFPEQLSAYYERSKAADVVGSVLGIQATLQDQIQAEQLPDTAFRIMFVSDLHLAAVYPLIGRYAETYDVSLIINTGDESAFGTTAELTPAYREAMAAVTSRTPMLWLAGNHDSPATQDAMTGIPGVTVLGEKERTADGYRVAAGVVDAFGLTVAGLPDPRVYGGPGAYGADDRDVTDPLQQEAVRQAVAGLTGDADPAAAVATAADGTTADGTTAAGGAPEQPVFDVFATHEPVAAEALREELPGMIRQTVAGHVHAQNEPDELQSDREIDLVEGSTGAGGLDAIARGEARPPIEFSIQTVGSGCEFTGIQRFRIDSTQLVATTADDVSAYGNDVTATTTYFTPQDVAPGRRCSTSLGIGLERPLPVTGR
ncbi:metallophosphoesterase [Modestobacter sp. I12A-02628]|uniref:Metallophosphoesterase n=2 Tax=Goekera deserti TaxID=2497753 RepID=A0A7K3WGM4_9ACTN|nr:metallophosphoesterase [Goekera deserti]NDI47086.1 metallophosphoesterase [Goekera deserti]NEL55516.1 metallophosphoesterase [Goekera deserti]